MLTSITLKTGNTTSSSPLKIPIDGITIFVGPNNSGKSLVLRELEAVITSGVDLNALKLLSDVEIKWIEKTELHQLIDILRNLHAKAIDVPADHVQIGRMNPHGGYEAANIHVATADQIVDGKTNWRWLTQNILRFSLLRLDGRTRFSLTDDKPSGDLLSIPANMLVKLLTHKNSRELVQKHIKDAFVKHFQIDPTGMLTLRIRLHDKPSEQPQSELSLDAQALNYQRAGLHIKEASDGVQAYTGILCAVCSGDYKLILIDEPEAFLHPPLAKKLGYQLATISKERGGAFFASTHSADFLVGCIQSGQPVQIVRLQYQSGNASAHVVDSKTLLSLFRDPLLRSSNVISALFYDGVIVCEADGDRVFYSEVLHRISGQGGTPLSILVLNARGKQSIRNLIGPLRKFGIPAAAICDIDIIKDGGATWKGWMSAAGVPDQLHDGLANIRNTIEKEFSTNSIDMKSSGGVNALTGSARSACEQLLSTVEEYGIFVVPGGELESWLGTLAIKGKKDYWVDNALQSMGSDPMSDTYVTPQHDDVWGFMESIIKWVSNPSRKGMDQSATI